MRVAFALTVMLGCSGPSTPAATTPADPVPVAPTEPAEPTEPDPSTPPSEPIREPSPPAERVDAAELESPATSPRRNPQSQAEIAARRNEEGKAALLAGQTAEASAKFREAVARVPEPSYFHNLCLSLYQEGKFGEAMTACDAVGKNDPLPALARKTAKLIERIKDEAKQQGIQVAP